MNANNLFTKEMKNSKRNNRETIINLNENKKDPKYKTELCKKWLECGSCAYGAKCQFAHGKKELLHKIHEKNYKKKPCKSFNQNGYCPYGSRCNFKHDERELSEILLPYFIVDLYIRKEIRPSKRLAVFEEITNEHKSDCCSVSTLSNEDYDNELSNKNEGEKITIKDNSIKDDNFTISFSYLKGL